MSLFKIFENIIKIINIYKKEDEILIVKNYNNTTSQSSEQGIGWNYGHV